IQPAGSVAITALPHQGASRESAQDTQFHILRLSLAGNWPIKGHPHRGRRSMMLLLFCGIPRRSDVALEIDKPNSGTVALAGPAAFPRGTLGRRLRRTTSETHFPRTFPVTAAAIKAIDCSLVSA